METKASVLLRRNRDIVSKATVDRINHTGIHQSHRDDVCPRCKQPTDLSKFCLICKVTVTPIKRPCIYCDG